MGGYHRLASAAVESPATESTTDPAAGKPLLRRRRRVREWLLVVLGALALQAALLAPSLVGSRVLLPLDLLARPDHYLPREPGAPRVLPKNAVVSDLVDTLALHGELARDEIRAGRWPLWNPYDYCGAPLLASAQAQAFSPFSLVQIALPAPFPFGIAWAELLRSIAASCGAFLLFRRTLRARFWPAAIGAWLWPLTGFVTLWSGYPHAEVVLALPWLVHATWTCVRRPRGLATVELALATAFVLFAGHPGTAAAALVAAAIAGLAFLVERHRRRVLGRAGIASGLSLVLGFGLGAAVSAPQSLPTLEYLPETLRATARAAGQVDIAPVGVGALPLFFLPYSQGSNAGGSAWLLHGNHLESAAGGWAGLAVALVLAPLAFGRRAGRGRRRFLAVAAILFAAQPLAIPGVAELFDTGPMRLFQNNRFVLVTSLCVLSLGVLGLDAAWRARARIRKVAPFALVALLALCVWSAWRSFELPSALAPWIASKGVEGEAAARAEHAFANASRIGAGACALLIGAWIVLLARSRSGDPFVSRARTRVVLGAVAVFALAEVAAFHVAQVTQSPRELAYPPIPALERLAGDPSRICGMGCFPASLNLSHRLRDVRGYDGLDPARVVELIEACRHPQAPSFSYARTQWFVPRDLPLVDLLAIRWLVRRGKPGASAVSSSADYWVAENREALPRAFVPRRVEVAVDPRRRLELLSSPDFAPREVAYLEQAPTRPFAAAGGDARITVDEPDRVVVEAEMLAPGVLVLTDSWDAGWNARVGGAPAPVLRANHAFRAVELPAGRSTVEFRYEPKSFALGLSLAKLALGVLALWTLWCAVLRPRLYR